MYLPHIEIVTDLIHCISFFWRESGKLINLKSNTISTPIKDGFIRVPYTQYFLRIRAVFHQRRNDLSLKFGNTLLGNK